MRGPYTGIHDLSRPFTLGGRMSERKVRVTFRVAPRSIDLLQQLADAETGGNVSTMLRKLVSEALTARRDVPERP